jgi:hypothetical protein
MMVLSLRVAPPDLIDSALYQAPPEPLWPRYVSPWVHLLGGDGQAVPLVRRCRLTLSSSR